MNGSNGDPRNIRAGLVSSPPHGSRARTQECCPAPQRSVFHPDQGRWTCRALNRESDARGPALRVSGLKSGMECNVNPLLGSSKRCGRDYLVGPLNASLQGTRDLGNFHHLHAHLHAHVGNGVAPPRNVGSGTVIPNPKKVRHLATRTLDPHSATTTCQSARMNHSTPQHQDFYA